MEINSRDDLRLYVLRRCGHPVLKINVEEGQLQDRLDDAVAYFQFYSGEAQSESVVKHTITENDKAQRFIEVPTDVIAIKQMLPISPGFFPYWMSAEYQTYIMELKDLMSGSIDSYFITQRHLSLLNFLLAKNNTSFSFNSYTKILTINTDWSKMIPGSTFIVMNTTKTLSPDQYPALYKSYFLKELAYYFVMRQWATNLKKYSNVPLPGGITLNAQEMLDEATTAITNLTEQMKSTSDPLPFFITG